MSDAKPDSKEDPYTPPVAEATAADYAEHAGWGSVTFANLGMGWMVLVFTGLGFAALFVSPNASTTPAPDFEASWPVLGPVGLLVLLGPLLLLVRSVAGIRAHLRKRRDQ